VLSFPNTAPTEIPTTGQQWLPPRGIYYEHNRQRPKTPFLLRWTDGGVGKSQSFKDATDREKAAMDLAAKRVEHGTEILNFDPREWRRWLEFKERAGDHDPLEILHQWQVMRGDNHNAASAITVADAVEQYLAFRSEESLSRDTERHFDKHLRQRFAATHGAMRIREVTADTIKTWLGSLTVGRGKREGQKVEPLTRRNHRKDLNTFLDYCVRVRGWIARNPCDAVAVPAVVEADVSLLTIEQGRRLFAMNKGKPVLGRLALEAFGFLRASSAGRLRKEHINFEERGIRMPGLEHKSRKAKFRQGHPDNLWKFLEAAPDACWEMKWWQYRNEKAVAFAVAGIPSSNRLRKTCLSAHLAWLKNQPLTSYLAQHRHMSTTDIYLGVMTEANGKAWFEITP
jgi:integrase